MAPKTPGLNSFQENMRVRVTGDDAPPGVWMTLTRSPDGPSWWWLTPSSDDALQWANTHPGHCHSRCIQLPASRFTRAAFPAS